MLFSRNAKCHSFFPILFLLLWAVLLRFPTFGHPALYIDEDWYLYVGGQFLNGYLPYVDIWDRKPFGLFLLYAPFALFGKYRFLAYQLGALIFAWGTALFILQIVRKFISLSAGICAAALYLVLLNDLGGCGGQAPVFYNFFTGFAFYLVLNRFEEIKINALSLSITGIQAMFLLGLAIEIKPTVVFEGVYLGCFLLITCWQTQKNVKSLFLNSFFWIFTALLPSLIVAGFYAKIGHFQEWYFANILSSFLRPLYVTQAQLLRVIAIFSASFIVWSIAFVSLWKMLLVKERAYFLFLTGWLSVAALAIAAVPPYNPIYVLPFCLPFALFSGFFLLHQQILGRLMMAGLLIIASGNNVRYLHKLLQEHDKATYFQLQKIAQEEKACLFEYGGVVTMLDLTSEMAKNCHLTKYAFPTHLSTPNEEGAIGVKDAGEELRNILRQEPKLILVGADYFAPEVQAPFTLKQNAILREALQSRYHLLWERKEKEAFQLYVLNDRQRNG